MLFPRWGNYYYYYYLLAIYRFQIRSTFDYWSQVWGDAPKFTLNLLNVNQNRAIRVNDKPDFTDNLPLSLAHAHIRKPLTFLMLFQWWLLSRNYLSRSAALLEIIRPPTRFRGWDQNQRKNHNQWFFLNTFNFSPPNPVISTSLSPEWSNIFCHSSTITVVFLHYRLFFRGSSLH